MPKFAAIGAGGVLRGFYDSDAGAVPDGVIALTDAQYAAWFAAQFTLVWTGTELGAAPAPVAPPPVVPSFISRYQLKAFLHGVASGGATVLDDVAAWVPTLPAATQIVWAEAQIFSRNGGFISAAAAHFSWSSATVDGWFTAAAAIPAAA